MPVRLRCKCEAVLALHKRYIGRKARCPECRWEFIVPEPIEDGGAVPSTNIQAYRKTAGNQEKTAVVKGQDLNFHKFQQLLGDDGDDLPSLSEDGPAGQQGPQNAADLAPERTATEIMVERAFNGPEEEYKRIHRYIRTDKEAPHLYSQLGDICLSLGRRDEAIDAYDKAIKLDGSYDYLESKVKELMETKEYAKRTAPPAEEPPPEEEPPSQPTITKKTLTKRRLTKKKSSTKISGEPSSRNSIKDILFYPLKGKGRMSIMTCSLLATGLWYGVNHVFSKGNGAGIEKLNQVAAGTLFFISIAYFFGYLIRIIRTSAEEQTNLPEWPQLARWWAEILRPNLCLLLHAILCIVIPAKILSFAMPLLAAKTDVDPHALMTLRIGLMVAIGFLYLPMAGLTIGVSSGFSALNPLRVLISIFKTIPHYILAILLFAFSLGSAYSIIFVGQKTSISFPLDIPAWMLFFFFTFATARALGLLYPLKKDKGAWEKKKEKEMESPSTDQTTATE